MTRVEISRKHLTLTAINHEEAEHHIRVVLVELHRLNVVVSKQEATIKRLSTHKAKRKHQ